MYGLTCESLLMNSLAAIRTAVDAFFCACFLCDAPINLRAIA